MQDLDTKLLRAHECRDHDALVVLYAQAADEREQEGDIDATCFYLTQAFIFALETGHRSTMELNRRLVDYGREAPL